MMFSFDDRYAMFDTTPVDNQFIQEYLPGAKGDYVRVYLYGLMRCYHPEETMTPGQMGQELNLTEDDILMAYRYWERRGLVRRVSDDPVTYRYVNLKQKSLSSESVTDPEYEAFAQSLYGIFDKDRQLHGTEISSCYEWVEDMKIQPEAVIMLLKHMAKVKGKNFRIRDAEKLAIRMANEKILTSDDAEEFLSRDREQYEGTRAVLKRLGKRNLPSEDQIRLYFKWTGEWGFTREAVLAACADTVAMPSMETLDTVLRKLKEGNNGNVVIDAGQVISNQQVINRLRKLMDIWGWSGLPQERIKWYAELERQFDPEIICLGARECAGKSGDRQQKLTELLTSWKNRGLNDRKAVENYIRAFRADSSILSELHKLWGTHASRAESDYERGLLNRWQHEFGYDREMILKAAGYAAEAEKPMAYLDKILSDYSQKGIRTPEEAEKEYRSRDKQKEAHGRKVSAQQYSQREYEGVQDSVAEMVERLRKEE